MCWASSVQKASWPTADLMPTGSPVAPATCSTKSTSSGTLPKAEWRLGLTTSWPTGTPRASAISGLTFAPGSRPPTPGFAPWDSFTSMDRTGAPSTVSSRRSIENVPSGLRHPK